MHYYTNLEGKSLRNFDEDFSKVLKDILRKSLH
jgi:hypothetical protein